MYGILSILFLVLLFVAIMPNWNYSKNWGYIPSGVVSVAALVIVFLVFTGRI